MFLTVIKALRPQILKNTQYTANSRLSVFCYVDAHVICQRMRWQVYLQAELKHSFPSISQKEVHIAVTVLSSTTDLFSSFTVASDGFICASHLVLCSIINLFHTRLGRESHLMFYLAVSWGFPSDLSFLCSARRWCVSLLCLSVSRSVFLSLSVFREGLLSELLLLFVMWEWGGF